MGYAIDKYEDYFIAAVVRQGDGWTQVGYKCKGGHVADALSQFQYGEGRVVEIVTEKGVTAIPRDCIQTLSATKWSDIPLPVPMPQQEPDQTNVVPFKPVTDDSTVSEE